MSHNGLRTPADLIAASPALLHHVPVNSMVIFFFQAHPIHGLFVDGAGAFDITATVAQAAAWPADCKFADSEYCAAALLSVCDEEYDAHARELLDATKKGLQDCGLFVLRRLSVRDVTQQGLWRDIDDGTGGQTYPYTDSPVVAAAVLAGTTIYRHRDDISAIFNPTETAAPLTAEQHNDFAKLAVTTVTEVAGILTDSIPADDPGLASRVGAILTTNAAVRNLLVGLAADHPEAAARLWTRFAQQLRGRARHEALIIAAVACYLARDYLRAQIAVEVAITEAVEDDQLDPARPCYLRQLFQQSVQPGELRAAITTAMDLPAAGG